MNKEVYLIYASLRLPELNHLDDISKLFRNASSPKLTSRELNNGQKVEFGELDLSKEEEAVLPSRQDAKIMRKDVLAVTVCAREILANSGLNKRLSLEIPSYISSGAFIEGIFNQNDKVSKYFRQAVMIENDIRRKEMLYKVIPPLMALTTLTNAASSYVAQYTGFAGRNATYGNTSISGSYAILSAWQEIQNRTRLALAGATNRGDAYSYLTFCNQYYKSEFWRESTGASLMILCDKEHLDNTDDKAFCIIEDISFTPSVPSLTKKPDFGILENKELNLKESLIVFSGAYTEEVYKQQKELFSKYSEEVFSCYPILGSTGAINMQLNVFIATKKLRNSKYNTAICIDKDPFGRESFIRIKLPN